MADIFNVVVSLVVGFVLFVGLIVLHVKLFFPFYTKEGMEKRNIH